MASDRQDIIKKIEKARGSRVISYVTSTRGNLEVPMALDIVRYMFDRLGVDQGIT
jgi:hypothetical protein